MENTAQEVNRHQEKRTRENVLYKHDQIKQWACAILFLLAGLKCWQLVEEITKNENQIRIAIIAVLGLQAYSLWQYYQWRRETMDTLQVLEVPEPTMKKILDDAVVNKPALASLGPIWDKLHSGRLHHQDILVHITSLQYALASTLILASLGGGIAAFFILPTGWNGAKPLLTTLFLSMVVMVTYCQMTPKVLSLSSNLTVHLARYHAFIAIRWQVYRYAITGKGSDGNEQTAESFLNELTQQLIELPPAPFGIDPSQVTSISALAQQFNFRSVSSEASDSKQPRTSNTVGGRQHNGINRAHDNGHLSSAHEEADIHVDPKKPSGSNTA